jgi:hypothetical protein
MKVDSAPQAAKKKRVMPMGAEQGSRTHILEILVDCQSFSV